jgi:hypothetical protein
VFHECPLFKLHLPQLQEVRLVSGSDNRSFSSNCCNLLSVFQQSDRSSSSTSDRERKRLKKRRREKLKRLLASAAGGSGLPVGLKKHRKRHRCGGEDRCRHKRHHKRHRKHRHRTHNVRNKDSSSGSSSADSVSRPGMYPQQCYCYVEGSRPPLWSSGQSSWLQNRDVLCFL